MDKDRIIEKIKKCLALGKSCEPHEAALAMERAQELMARYGVTADEVSLSEISKKQAGIGKTKNPPRYQHYLITMVKRVFGCEAILSAAREWQIAGSGWHTDVSFIGFGPNPELAAYTFDVLLKQLIRGRKEYMSTLDKRLKRSTKTRRGDLWAEAWVLSAADKAKTLTLSREKKDLINKWQDLKYADRELKEANPRQVRNQGRGDHEAVRKGYEAGKEATLHHGMNGSVFGQLKIGA